MLNFKKCQIVAEGCDNHFGKLYNAKKIEEYSDLCLDNAMYMI